MFLFCDKCGHKNEDSAPSCISCGEHFIDSPSTGTLKSGIILDGNYEIKRMVKAGGMGAVYEAIDYRFEKKSCAVKEMLGQTTDPALQQYLIERFKKEALILYELKHPNLPRVRNYFVEKGRYYLVMDYIEGKDLDTIMRGYEGGRVPEHKVIEWTEQILDALIYLHNHNPPVVYRDMKPGNVMVRSSDNKIILVDFGIARTIEPDGDKAKTAIGTPGFSPPEIFEGRPEERTDIYSLGATMHCLLTGVVPLTPFVFKPVSMLNPSVSPGLEAVVMKSLTMDIDGRYESASVMKKALAELSEPSQHGMAFSTEPSVKTIPYKTGTEFYQATVPVTHPVIEAGKRKTYMLPVLIMVILLLTGFLLTGFYINKNNKYSELYNKALSLDKEGKYEEAIKYYDEALSIKSDEKILNSKRNSIKSYGDYLFSKEKYREAVDYYDRVLEFNRDDKEVLYKKGLILSKDGKYREAIKYYDEALDIDGKYAPAHMDKGWALYKEEKYDEALTCYERALEIDPGNTLLWYNRGLALYDMGEYKEAVKSCDKALNISPDYIYAWNGKGEALVAQGKYKEGLDCFNKALKLDSKYDYLWNNKGECLYREGKYKEALTSFNKATSINPSNTIAWNNKGVTLYELGRYGESVKSYDKVLSLEPDNKIAKENREKALKFLNK
jgi:tetratricopeptide (TPR) repeat protein